MPGRPPCQCVCGHTITSEHKKLVIVADVVDNNVGIGSHNLLLGSKFSALLKLEVTDGARQSQVAVDTAKVDKPAGSSYPGLLAYWEKKKSKVSPDPKHQAEPGDGCG